jgi:dihydrofolate reductase
MFSGGEGPWASDPNADAWWGDNPPFHVPVFVLTHHEREPVVKEGGTTFTFVTDGIESALEQARAGAGDRDVSLGGGAAVAQQYLQAGLLDELHIHVVPTLLGGGVSLFGELGTDAPRLTLTKVAESPLVTHLSYEVAGE